jgi:hypothetical protein
MMMAIPDDVGPTPQLDAYWYQDRPIIIIIIIMIIIIKLIIIIIKWWWWWLPFSIWIIYPLARELS